MQKSKFNEAQIVLALRQADNDVKVEEVCRKLRVSDVTFYNWTNNYGSLGASELKKLKEKINVPLNKNISEFYYDI